MASICRVRKLRHRSDARNKTARGKWSQNLDPGFLTSEPAPRKQGPGPAFDFTRFSVYSRPTEALSEPHHLSPLLTSAMPFPGTAAVCSMQTHRHTHPPPPGSLWSSLQGLSPPLGDPCQIRSLGLTLNPGNSTQCSAILYMEKRIRKRVGMCITESLCCTPEANITL